MGAPRDRLANPREFHDRTAQVAALSEQLSGVHDSSPLAPLRSLAIQVSADLGALGGLARLAKRPDTATVVIANLRRCLGALFREKVLPLNDAAFAHASKCAITIMICELVCITLNCCHGIGCLETVMVVVQATLGGALVIGDLRLAGVMLGTPIAIGVVVFVMPRIATLPGLAMDFGTLLFGVRCAMGVVVTFIVYRFLWRAQEQGTLTSALMLRARARVAART
ncbi:MAG: hypothetical protein EXS03_00495 [Phycisphaerales bacterium]|nr:hypothetical protein [Phycisphaerales bacterium]